MKLEASNQQRSATLKGPVPPFPVPNRLPRLKKVSHVLLLFFPLEELYRKTHYELHHHIFL